MTYRLTLDTLVIGCLVFCLSTLAATWVLQQLGRGPERCGHEADRRHDNREGGVSRPTDLDPRHDPGFETSRVFVGSVPSGAEPGRVREGGTQPATRSSVG